MRRLCREASCPYQGNGSAADMEGLTVFSDNPSISPAQADEKSAEAIVVGETSRSAKLHSKVAGGLTRRRAEPNGNVLTAKQTPQPTTPDGEAWTRAGSMGSMWTFRSGLRPVSSRGLAPRLYGTVRTVVWDPGANHSRGPDSALVMSVENGLKLSTILLISSSYLSRSPFGYLMNNER